MPAIEFIDCKSFGLKVKVSHKEVCYLYNAPCQDWPDKPTGIKEDTFCSTYVFVPYPDHGGGGGIGVGAAVGISAAVVAVAVVALLAAFFFYRRYRRRQDDGERRPFRPRADLGDRNDQVIIDLQTMEARYFSLDEDGKKGFSALFLFL